MAAKIFQTLSLFSKKTAEHSVGGQTMVFHPVTLPIIWELQSSAKVIGKAIAAFSSAKTDVAHTSESTQNEETGAISVVNHAAAIDPVLAAQRAAERQEAIDGAVAAVFDPANRVMVGKIIANSARAEFEGASDADVKQVMDTVDLDVLIDFMTGVVKANSKVFGPFLDRLKAQFRSKMDEILGDQEQSSTESGEETDQDSTEPWIEEPSETSQTSTTPGES